MSKSFRYGNTISLREFGNTGPRNDRYLVASSEAHHPEPGGTWPAVLAIENFTNKTDWPGMRWTIRKASQPNDSARVRYGDVVGLCADGLLNTETFPCSLSAREGGAVTAMPWDDIGGNLEQWKILDPANPASTGYVNFGDTIALQSKQDQGYLSHAQPAFTRTVTTLGDHEKWVLELVPFALAVSSPLEESDLQAAKANMASVFRIPLDLAKEIVSGIASAWTMAASALIPGAGVLGKIVPFLWQDAGVDLWPLLRENVEAVVKDKIDEAKYADFKLVLEIVENQLKTYINNPTASEATTQLTNLVTTCDAVMTAVRALPRPEQSLPYIAIAGTLHIMTLHERWRRAVELWNEPPNVVAMRANAIAEAITKHQKLIDERKSAALQWRRGLVSSKQTPLGARSYVNDDFFGVGPWGRPSIGPELVYNDPFLEKYTSFVVRMFEEQLDSFLLPSRLWKYLKADNDEIPVRKTKRFSTGPHGWVDRETFIYDPETTPVAEIWMSAGWWIDTLTIRYERGEFAHYGTHGWGNQKIVLGWGEKIVKASGGMSGSHEIGARFESNQGHAIGGGRSENPWKSEPPANAQAFLAGISGHYDDERVSCLYLHWRYTAWE
ncbi:MAG TPA: hypothetical protein VJZ00_09510 [Thermoanaerobaculia bacterium]|nr:hypothetical protein [Thermoanaerobaculia bacterium]